MPFRLLAGLLLVSISVVPAFAAERPNVLWIIAEDFGPHLGCYGTPEARTPHLDALAAKGMRFTRAFSTNPVCSASRSAFMTGMYQTTIGAHNHRSHRDDGHALPDGVRVLPHWSKDADYFTANIVHLVDDQQERFYRGTGKTDWNFNIDGKPFESNRWSDLKGHQPFYAQINFSETHRGPAWNRAHEHIDQPADPAKVEIPPYYPDHPLVREDWAQYINTAMALDKKVGYVLDKLKVDGLAENTIVFFFGDHGQAMPRGKQWCYDSGLNVPLIVYWPESLGTPAGYEAASVSDRIVESIDFTATTLAIVGVDKPAKMQGRVLFGDNADLPREFAFAGRDRCDETVFRIRTVRTPRYRFIRNFDNEKPFLLYNRYKETTYPTIPLMRSLYAAGKLNDVQARLASPEPRPQEELYDLEADPYEINNLAASPEHQEIRKQLSSRLNQWIEESNDQGRTPESDKILHDALAKAKSKEGDDLKRLSKQWPNAYPLDPRFLNETWLERSSHGDRPGR